MPSGKDYINFVLINLGFISMVVVIYYWVLMNSIKNDWAVNRCNPLYMPFADDVEENFIYCVQNMQTSYMQYLLTPLNYISSSLISSGEELSENIQSIRIMIDSIRTLVSDIVTGIYSVFLNIIIEIQKITISLKDLVAKIIGVVVIILNIMGGSIMTMDSAWSGPPGQMVKALGSACFHEDTKLMLFDERIVLIKNLNLGDVLKDGQCVCGILKLKNTLNEPFYKFSWLGEENDDIYITGNHFVLYNNNWVNVKFHPEAKKTDIVVDNVYNLITNKSIIPVGKMIFHDYNDDDVIKI